MQFWMSVDGSLTVFFRTRTNVQTLNSGIPLVLKVRSRSSNENLKLSLPSTSRYASWVTWDYCHNVVDQQYRKEFILVLNKSF